MKKEKIVRTEADVTAIKEFMTAHGFETLAAFGKAVGMERQNVWMRVVGRTDPDIRMLLKWSVVLECEIEDLIRLFYPNEYSEYERRNSDGRKI